ncbi:unnamed protein product [Arabis nemorensis]|uniref:Rho termination factor-like N-terminal domain-containing protein n=1 Tax=Arabis nemorensis TaxID=586526 RepID=A0A565CG31_9BRAS|nr:unnamed protein product [Arabis nemorensis]
MGRSKKGSVCCKKQSDPSKLNQEEIISLFRRIQSSISKGKSPEGLEGRKNRDGTPENVPLSKAILDILEKPRKKTEGDTRVKEPPERQVKKVTRPPSSFAKRSPIRPTSGPRGKLPITQHDKALKEMTEKEEKAPLIETMKLAELKEVAKNRGIKGYSKLKKSELLKLIRSS